MWPFDNNPADAGMEYLNKLPGEIKPYFDPYMQQGKDAYGQLNPLYSKMMGDPTGYLDQMMQKYKPSSGYQQRRNEALRAAGNTAAAGGMRGSAQDQISQGRLADSLMNDDMQQWLQNVMGLQDRGMSGQQHFYDTGYDASKSYAGDLSNIRGTQSQLAFQGQANKNKMISDLIGALVGAGGMAAGAYFGS